MTFDKVNSPKQLMQFLDENINYGVIDKDGNIYNDSSSDDFQKVCFTDWQTKDIESIISSGIGHCYDQVEIQRQWFCDNGYKVYTFWISAYQEGIPNSGFSHTYLVYQQGGKYYYFEHADCCNKGIYQFDSLLDAVKFQANNQIKYATSCIKPKDKYSVCIKLFDEPPIGLDMMGYLDFVNSCKDYNIDLYKK